MAEMRSHKAFVSGSSVPGIDQNEQAVCVRDSTATTLRAESPSIFLNNSGGGRKTASRLDISY